MNAHGQHRMPTYFISHGGGPWPWMPERHTLYASLAAALADIPRQVGRSPRAILMVSAHWEATTFTVQGAAHPGMLYDYYGFPEHTYQVLYASPGSPQLAARTLQMIEAASLPAAIDRERGYDHGMFAPLAVMFPEADVPVVQLSLLDDLQPQAHVQLGRAIAALRDEDVLIVGSGLSYHNMQAFASGTGQAGSANFDAWLRDTMLRHEGQARTDRLLHWERAPSARDAHPREEHLIPLMVAVGAAEHERATCVHQEGGAPGRYAVSSYRLG